MEVSKQPPLVVLFAYLWWYLVLLRMHAEKVLPHTEIGPCEAQFHSLFRRRVFHTSRFVVREDREDAPEYFNLLAGRLWGKKIMLLRVASSRCASRAAFRAVQRQTEVSRGLRSPSFGPRPFFEAALA